MTTFKKVLTIIAMVLAVVGMAACLVGIIGGWAINAPLTNDAVAALTGLSKTLKVADSALADAGDGLATARGVVGQIEGITAAAGDRLDQSGIDALADLTQGKLGDAIAKLEQAGRTISGTVEAINGLIATLNRVPGVQIKPLESAQIDKVTGLIAEISQTLRQVVGAIEAVRSGVADALAGLKQIVGGLDGRLAALEAAVSQIQPQIQQALSSVNALILRAPAFIDLLFVVLTILLLWLGFAQFGLFMWMRSLYKAL